jgi:flagellar protein FliO/FliZ
MRSCWPIIGFLGAMQLAAPLATRAQGPSVYEPAGYETGEYEQPGRLSQAVAIEARPLTAGRPQSPEAMLKPFPFRQASAIEPGEHRAPASESRQPLKLSPRGNSSERPLAGVSAATPSSAIGTVASSLAIVIGLLLAVAWITRRFAPPGAAPLPPQAIELLGRQPLGGKQSLQLLRIGNKLLLVALSPGGAQTLTEITDPVEVEQLAGICRRTKTDSASAAFSRVLSQLATEPASDAPRTPTVRANARGAA